MPLTSPWWAAAANLKSGFPINDMIVFFDVFEEFGCYAKVQ